MMMAELAHLLLVRASSQLALSSDSDLDNPKSSTQVNSEKSVFRLRLGYVQKNQPRVHIMLCIL